MRPQPFWIDACEIGLAEVERPLDFAVASLAECSQIPRQQIPLVAIQMVNSEAVRWVAVLGSAEFAAPAGSSSYPS